VSERFRDVAQPLTDNGYLVVPVKWGEKAPVPKDWPRYRFQAADLGKYATCGTGILTGAVVGVDIDVLRPDLAAALEEFAKQSFGDAPRRVGKAPKSLRVYRAAEPFGKIQTPPYRFPDDAAAFKGHKVEILAAGQQFVSFNLHPDTRQLYIWHGAGSPLDTPVDALPAITEAQARAFIAECAVRLQASGALKIGRFAASDADRKHVPNEQQRARRPEECSAALAAIPNEDEDFDSWLQVLLAAKGALGAEGKDAFFAWSAKSAKHDAANTAKEWAGANPTSLGAGTIYHLAREHGWRPAETDSPVTTADFYAYMPGGNFIFLPTRELWPGSSVNVRCADPQAASWIAQNRPVDQMTWAPGEPALIEGRVVDGGGWVEREGFACLNLYRPPQPLNGDATRVQPWLAHLQKLYSGESEHIVRWLAHRVQHPADKINHALVLGGAQGIGKDTLLEAVKYAVGPWNFIEVSPAHLIGRFNGFVKSVILRVSEARDLGDIDRYAFYDHMKIYTAAPPDVLRCDEKNLREHYVLNVCGVIITTNHKAAGLYLPADDRRHHVSWSELTKEDFSPEYWRELWSWYGSGGIATVAAYLAAFDLAGWDPKAPPPKTEAFWDIVGANRAPEDAELADVLEQLGNPAAVTKKQMIGAAETRWADIAAWLQDRRNARQVPHRMETVGYVSVRNEADQRDGLWKIDDNRCVIYALKTLSLKERLIAAAALVAEGRR
jgi:Primase C terminal 2 (PriCT-2)/Family of unknown function (DUF5906)